MESERIEILSVDLLETERDLVDSFSSTARGLGIDLGWHYLLDLAWIARHLGEPRGMRILDAGAGTGVLQWWLADRGAEVISVDRADRSELSIRFRLRYRVRGMRRQDLLGPCRLAFRRAAASDLSIGRRLAGAARALGAGLAVLFIRKAPGRVVLYHRDLADLGAISDASMDAVVAVSALEHNDPSGLPSIVDELWRLLKPGGRLIVTLAAAKDRDWFHEPSRGWCYSEGTLRSAFRLPPQAASNYPEHDALFARLRESRELRENLSAYYFRGGQSGMPWGEWDPQYQPVGVLRIKG